MEQSQTYRIAVVDDETSCVDDVLKLLEQYRTDHKLPPFQIDTYNNEAEFANTIDKKSYDLYFLDIFLGKTTGIELAKRIREKNKNSNIIFVTTSDGFYKDAFKLQAVQYLEKPIDTKTLFECLERIFYTKTTYINIKDGKKQTRIAADDIIYIKSNEHYKYIVTTTQDYMVNVTMKELVAQINTEYFYAVNSRLVINLKRVIEVLPDSILMTNKHRLPLSKGNYKTIGKEMLKYLF